MTGDAAPTPAETGITPVRAGLLAAGGTLLLAGTLFLRYPQGLSAFASSLPAYFEGWTVSSMVPLSRLFIAFLTYPLAGIVFGVVAMVRAWTQSDEHATGRALSLWLVISFLFALAYPGRQVADLAWVLVPLWGLAGLEFSRYLEVQKGDFVPWALAALVVVMLVSVWTNLAGLAASDAQGETYWLRWIVIGGAMLLAVLSSILVGLGWSRETASRGLAWGVAMALGVGMLAGIWSASQREITNQIELWRPLPGPGHQALLMKTLGDLGDWDLGREDSVQVVSLVESPALHWVLRAMPNVRFETGLNRAELPDVIITQQDFVELNLGSSYRGQDFEWWTYPNWDTWTGTEWLKWLTFREGTGTTQILILWGRGDLFPSGDADLGEGTP